MAVFGPGSALTGHNEEIKELALSTGFLAKAIESRDPFTRLGFSADMTQAIFTSTPSQETFLSVKTRCWKTTLCGWTC